MSEKSESYPYLFRKHREQQQAFNLAHSPLWVINVVKFLDCSSVVRPYLSSLKIEL